MSTRATNTPALPGLKTAAADAARSTRRLCASWTESECQFADACINAWNTAFKNHGTRANRTRHGQYVAVHLLRWINGPDNDGERMTPDDVFVAIRAYAADPWIREKCGGRFKSFPDWMKDAPDAVDKQLTRIGKRRGHAAPTNPGDRARALRAAAANGDPKAKLEIARTWLKESGWAGHIAEAARRNTSEGKPASLPESLAIRRVELLRQMDLCKTMPPRLAILHAELNDLDRRQKAIADFKTIDPAARRNIFNRARAATAAMKQGREQVAATLALAVEIFTRYGTSTSDPKIQLARKGAR